MEATNSLSWIAAAIAVGVVFGVLIGWELHSMYYQRQKLYKDRRFPGKSDYKGGERRKGKDRRQLGFIQLRDLVVISLIVGFGLIGTADW